MNAKELLISKLVESKRQVDVIQGNIDTLENSLKLELNNKEKLHQDIISIENALHQMDSTTVKITLSEAIKDYNITIRFLNYEEDKQLREELHRRDITRYDGSSYLDKMNYMFPINNILFFPSTGRYAESSSLYEPTVKDYFSGKYTNLVDPTKTYYLYEVDLTK